jgi:hypothetical protein
MMNQYTIYDNFLDDTTQFVELMRSQKYFCQGREKNSSRIETDIPLEATYAGYYLPDDPRERSPNWRGYRTKDIQKIDENIHDIFYAKLFEKLFGGFSIAKIDYSVETYFHLLTKEFVPDEAWIHTDPMRFFAGVLYLSENPEPNSGTLLHIGDEKISVENKFNRLVVYNGSIKHRMEGSFGDSINNCRSTISFFVKDIAIYSDPSNLF